MGVTNVLYNFGFDYDNPKKPYQMQGFVNSPARREIASIETRERDHSSRICQPRSFRALRY
jgi:hypothetical protein